jgi:ectoine hydroxylase-related dioxygenase (phytanoyl-CoA dioxygenase family)
VPWHQDSAYFEPYCDQSLVLTVWLPLVDANAENGCLWVIPRAHHGEVIPHHRSSNDYLEIGETDLPPGEAICAEVPKGGVLLLTNRTPHASFENRSDHVRWSMDLRYQSAALPTNARINRLEGEVVGTDEGEVPVACYPPEADFLVRSRTRPEQVIQTAEAFAELRTQHQGRPVSNRWNVDWGN